MRFALFYHRADGKAVATVAPVHAVAGGIEVEVIGEVGIALVGRRAPIVAVLSNEVGRRPVTPTGGGKEDGFAVLAGDFIAIMATLCCPCPGTLVHKFLALCLGRQSPRTAPPIARYIVRGVTADVTHTLVECLAIVFVVTRLSRSFAPGVKIAVVGGRTGANVACRPLDAETQVYISMVIDKAIRIRYLY